MLLHKTWEEGAAPDRYPFPMNWKAEIGRRIREVRRERGLTLEELAKKTRTLSFSRISNYEQGYRKASEDAIRELSEALGADPAYFACYTDTPGSESNLSEDEQKLLEKYRQTDERGRKQIHHVAESQPSYLTDGEERPDTAFSDSKAN